MRPHPVTCLLLLVCLTVLGAAGCLKARHPAVTPDATVALPAGQQLGFTKVEGGELFSRTLAIVGLADNSAAAEERKTLPDFYMSTYEITNAQFDAFKADGYDNDKYWSDAGLKWRADQQDACLQARTKFNQNISGSCADYPVVVVTYYEAAAFCNWLSDISGKNITLPSNAEWEYAAKGPGRERMNTRYPWGGTTADPTDDIPQAAYKTNTGFDLAKDSYAWTAPVGSFPQDVSWCGVYDMCGNAAEWVAATDGQYPERGGAWMFRSDPKFAPDMRKSIASLFYIHPAIPHRPEFSSSAIGFRVVMHD